MSARVLQFGVTGQVGQCLIAQAATQAIALRALDRNAADLADPGACAAAVRQSESIQAVIIAAAYTKVDQAQTERALAWTINADAPAAIAAAAAERAVPVIHLSTDYVFDGTKGSPYAEDDAPAPLSVYGASKRAGEIALAACSPHNVTIRTSWVFAPHGGNFVRTMLQLSTRRDFLSIVDDQVGGPTAADDIADAVLRIARQRIAGDGQGGVFHFASAPAVSWAGFAEAIFEHAAPTTGKHPEIKRIPTSDYPTAAARPLDTRLDCRKIEAIYGIARPDWRRALARTLDTLFNGEPGS